MPTRTVQDNSNHKARNWVFTLNNYTDVEIAKLMAYADDKCNYMIFAKEVGNSGTPHLQGYMQLKQQTLGQTVKNQSKLLRLYLEIANGSPEKNFDYCVKQYFEKDAKEEIKEAVLDEAIDVGDIYITGKPVDPVKAKAKGSAKGGAATKAVWANLNADVVAGFTEKELKDKYPHLYYKHQQGIRKGMEVEAAVKPRKEKTCVHVVVGPPGVGKTTYAQECVNEKGYWYDSQNGNWWDGYNGSEGVVIDDFHGNLRFDFWKKLTDKYPMHVSIKGGTQVFNSKLIVITSNEPPSNWWKPEVLGTHGMAALYRRINVLLMWDEAEKKFVPQKPAHELWSDGCLCERQELSKVNQEQIATLELSDGDDQEHPIEIEGDEEDTDSGPEWLKTSSLPLTDVSPVWIEKALKRKSKPSPPPKKRKIRHNVIGGPVISKPLKLKLGDEENSDVDDPIDSFDELDKMDEGVELDIETDDVSSSLE